MFSATLKPLSVYTRQHASDRAGMPAHLSNFFAVCTEARLTERWQPEKGQQQRD